MITFETAKNYLDRGWSVIPVILSYDSEGNIQKKPMIPWKEYQTRKPTEEELHQWFDGNRVNGIGLVTGKVSRIVVVDDDNADEKAKQSTPLLVKTISGGHHYYYRWTKEIRNDANNKTKIDFRGDGGFVVLPPSELDGKKYEWLREFDTMFLSDLPKDIEEKLKVKKENTWTEVIPDEPITVGARNVTATQYAGMLIRNMNEKLWNTVGFTAFQEWNEKHCIPPQDNQALLATWKQITRNEKNKRELQGDSENQEKELIRVYAGEEVTNEYNSLIEKYGDGIETGFTELDEYFSFMPEQLYLLSASTHQGKTVFALNMAARIASLDYPVIFASLEQGIFIDPRIRTIMGGPVPEKFSILCSEQTISIATFIEYIESLEIRPKLLVIDHLHFIKKIKAEATEAIDDMIIGLQNMAKRLHLPVLVIAHVRKLNEDRPPRLDDLRDSSSLSQVPSVVILLYRKKSQSTDKYLEDEGIITIAKNRIKGKTGSLRFKLEVNGEFNFKSPDVIDIDKLKEFEEKAEIGLKMTNKSSLV